MPVSDADTPVRASSDAVDGKSARIAALQHLYRAYQKTTIYPREHPSIPQALGAAMGGFEAALAQCDPLVVGVTPEALLIDGESLAESSGALQALAALLHDLDLARIEFHGGISREELEGFIFNVGEARREGFKGSALIDALKRAEVPNVRLSAIDYDALEFADGARDTAGDAEQEDLWEFLQASLAEPEADDPQRSPEDAAGIVAREIERNEGTGIAELRRDIERMSRAIDSAPPEKRPAGRERLAKFIAALSRKLRWDLLRIDLGQPEESVTRLTELADVVPETDLLAALQEIDRAGARVPAQLITLMNKLVRLSHTRPTLASGIEDTLRKWGMPEAMINPDSVEYREALGEVFQRRGRLQYNPGAYQGLLDGLARCSIDGEAYASLDRYRDPRDAQDAQLHMAEVAVRLLARRGGEQYGTGLLAQIGALTDLMIRHGCFDSVRDAVLAARALSVVETAPEAVRQAARLYLDGFLCESRVQLILEMGFSGDSVPEAAVNLLALGGVTSLDRAIEILAGDPAPAVARSLVDFIKDGSAELLGRVLKWRCDRGGSAVRPVVPVLRELSPDRAVALVQPMLDHQDPEIRREAVSLTADVHPDPPACVGILRGKLIDDSLQVVYAAVRALARVEDPAAVEALGTFVEGGLGRHRPATESALQAVRGLAGKGEPGVARLCRVLRSLSRSWRPGRLRVARRIQRTLEARRDVVDTERCLSEWRHSLAGRLLRLTPWIAGTGSEGR